MDTIGRMILPAMVAGFILDQILGDPHWMYHPVRLVGKLIQVLEGLLRNAAGSDEKKQRQAGLILVLAVSGITTMMVCLLVHLSLLVSPGLCFLIMVLLDYWLFAVKSLKDESMKVYERLMENDLTGARRAVSMIVGRDTENLTVEGVTRAAVETVAENTSDGVIAPLVCMAVGGPVLGWWYKSINTMDSMVGYKDEKYLNIGRYAAKLDDIVNFVPARISAFMMMAVCPLIKLDIRSAWKIFRRDRYHHASPNSAQTEAVAAGALHVELAGDAWYFGKLYHKETIGDPDRKIVPEDIRRVNRLMYAASVLTLAVCCVMRLLMAG